MAKALLTRLYGLEAVDVADWCGVRSPIAVKLAVMDQIVATRNRTVGMRKCVFENPELPRKILKFALAFCISH